MLAKKELLILQQIEVGNLTNNGKKWQKNL
jgi:hypothetical protein